MDASGSNRASPETALGFFSFPNFCRPPRGLPMAGDRFTLVGVRSLLDRELRNAATWGLAAFFWLYGVFNVWPGGGDPTLAQDLGPIRLGPISFTSWINVLGLVMIIMIPLWIMERIPLDHKGRWFDPLWVAGWSRGTYVVSLFAVIVGLGTAIFLSTVLAAWALSFVTGVQMPDNALSMALAGVPTFLAFGGGGLFLATIFRDRGLAMIVAILGIILPVAVTGVFLFKFDRALPDVLRTLFSIHVPPPQLDLSVPRVLHKLAYASVTLWLSVVLGGRLLGRRP
jgi:amino acid transporter